MAFEQVDWKKLMADIDRGTCTPFIGAGACAEYFPLGVQLAEALAEDDDYFMRSRKDLAAVAQYMAVNHADGNYPKREIAAFFGFQDPGRDVVSKDGLLARLYQARQFPDPLDEDDPHAVLADIRSAVYLTTNYDDFMFKAVKARALANGLVDVKRDLCRWTNTLFEQKRSPFDAAFDPSRKQPIVYHLHGHADVPDSIVVTEDDYTDFVVNLSGELAVSKNGRGKKERLPNAIRNAIRNNTLLFVGYHVADQNLRIILRLLSQTLGMAEQRLNVAIQLPDSEGADLSMITHIQQYLEARYRWSLRLQVYWGDAREFAKELRKQMNNRRSPAGSHAA